MTATKENKNENNNIYQKFQIVQDKIGQLAKTGENKFQKYNYVNEYEILSIKTTLKRAKFNPNFWR